MQSKAISISTLVGKRLFDTGNSYELALIKKCDLEDKDWNINVIMFLRVEYDLSVFYNVTDMVLRKIVRNELIIWRTE